MWIGQLLAASAPSNGSTCLELGTMVHGLQEGGEPGSAPARRVPQGLPSRRQVSAPLMHQQAAGGRQQARHTPLSADDNMHIEYITWTSESSHMAARQSSAWILSDSFSISSMSRYRYAQPEHTHVMKARVGAQGASCKVKLAGGGG
jgi:hypothetical protein